MKFNLAVRTSLAMVFAVAAATGSASAVSASPIAAPQAGQGDQVHQASAAASYQYMTETSFVVKATSYCLDSNSDGLGNNVGAVYTLPCNGGDYQKWDMRVNLADPMEFQLVNKATGRCLDGSSGRAYALPCNGGVYQIWSLFLNNQTNSGVVITHAEDGTNIDANGQGVNVVLAETRANGNSYQTFSATAPDANLLGGSTFKNAYSGNCLDSNLSGSAYDHVCNGGSYQFWLLYYHLSTGYYTMVDDATDRCLDSNGTAQGQSGSVYTLSCNGGGYQSWQIYPNGNAGTGMQLQDAQTTLILYDGPKTTGPCNCTNSAWYWSLA